MCEYCKNEEIEIGRNKYHHIYKIAYGMERAIRTYVSGRNEKTSILYANISYCPFCGRKLRESE